MASSCVGSEVDSGSVSGVVACGFVGVVSVCMGWVVWVGVVSSVDCVVSAGLDSFVLRGAGSVVVGEVVVASPDASEPENSFGASMERWEALPV